MAFLIDSSTLAALGNSKRSIRSQCLRELDITLNNNIAFNSLLSQDFNELQVVDLTMLTKQLIFWFNFEDFSDEQIVLRMILKIFRKKYFLEEIKKNLSIERLLKEFKKVSKIVNMEESHGLIEEINNILNQNIVMSSESSMIDLAAHLETIDLNECTEDNLILAWKELAGLDLEAINGIHRALKSAKNGIDLESQLKNLVIEIKNYPIEFFLQTPNILNCLLEIRKGAEQPVANQILEIVCLILNYLAERIKSLQGIDKIQTPVRLRGLSLKSCTKNIILMALSEFCVVCQEPNELTIQLNFRSTTLTQLYIVLFNLAKVISKFNCICDVHLNELLNGLAAFAKTLRMSYEISMHEKERTHYLITMYLMNSLLFVSNVDSFIDSEEHSLWEYESDLALLDIPFKVCYPVVYKIIKRNRIKCIKNDHDMQTLLRGNKVWIHVVELLKSGGSYRHEDVVEMGLQSLDTIYIHQSVDFINFLFNAVLKSTEQFPDDNELQDKNENIVLRLLANKMHEVKRVAYELVAKSVKRRISDDTDRSNSKNLCLVLGMPLTTEIVVEILCFGLGHSDFSIDSNAEIIIQTLLRAKCICVNNWLDILEIMRPVLPLLPCIDKHEKLSLFAFEVFNTGFGLNNDELKNGFGSFLFSSNYNLRARAKDNLFQLLGLHDQIDLVDGNLCILDKSLITRIINIPQQSNSSFNPESFTKLTTLLKEINRNNLELLRSVLLQLDIMMMSTDVMMMVHDSHIWVYIIESLGASFTHHDQIDILKLTISMLYKLCFAVPSFRKFLANEHELNLYVIKALVFHSNDAQIKKHSTSLLFILMFNDFFVGSGRNLSLPHVFKNLQCPFEFNFHWIESPFDQPTPLETIFLNIDRENNTEVDSYNITWRYLRFVFGSIWFEGLFNVISKQVFRHSLYFEKSDIFRTMQFNEKLLLTEQDVTLLEHTSVTRSIAHIIQDLEQSMTAKDVLLCFAEIERLLILPIDTIDKSPQLVKCLRRCIKFCGPSNEENQLLLKVLSLIIKFVTGEFPGFEMLIISELYNKSSVLTRILKDQANNCSLLYQELLMLIKHVLAKCFKPSIDFETELNELKKNHKISFIQLMFETLTGNLEEEIINEENLSKTLSVLRSLLSSNVVVNSDRQYVNVLIQKLMRYIYLNVKRMIQSSTSLLKSIMAVVLQLIGLHEQVLENQDIKLLLVLAKEKDSSVRELTFEIMAKATRYRTCCHDLMKESSSFSSSGLLGVINLTIMNENEDTGVKSAAVGILANLIQHCAHPGQLKDSLEAQNKDQQILQMLELLKNNNFYNKLLECFLLQGSVFPNLKTYCFLIKKLIQLDTFIISDLIERNVLQGLFNLIPMCKHIDASNALNATSQICDILIYCWQDKAFRKLLQHSVFQTNTSHISDLFDILHVILLDEKEAKIEPTTTVLRNICNLLQILVTFAVGLSDVLECLEDKQNCQTFVYMLSNGLQLNNRYCELAYHLCFLRNILGDSGENLVKKLSKQEVSTNFREILFRTSCKDQKMKPNHVKLFDAHSNLIDHHFDIIFLRVMDVYINIDHLKYSIEYKLELKALAHSVLVKILKCSQRANQIVHEIKLLDLVMRSFKLTVLNMNSIRHQEAAKKFGVKKCNYIIKELFLQFKALSEFNLSLNHEDPTALFNDSVKIFDWIEADSFLLSAYIKFLCILAKTNYSRKCLLETNAGGRSMIKVIVEKIKQLTVRTPHTENNVLLLKSGLDFLKICCHLLEFRIFLKKDKIFRILENLHPLVNKHKKSTYDEVVTVWLEFLETFSQYADTECDVGLISLLCRMVREGNKIVRELSLKVIRNFSLKSSIGAVLLSSEDFTFTVELIMTQNEGTIDEKYLVVMTLLSLTCKCERLKAKVKNSKLCRKLKLALINLEANTPETCRLSNCIYMLNQILMP